MKGNCFARSSSKSSQRKKRNHEHAFSPDLRRPPYPPGYDEDIEKELVYVYRGDGWLLENSYRNFKTILKKKRWWADPAIHPDSEYRGTTGGRLCFNTVTGQTFILVEQTGQEEGAGEYGVVRARYQREAFDESWFSFVCDSISGYWGIDPDHTYLRSAILHASFDRPFHPVQEYLSKLEWDGLPRLHFIASDILRIPNPTLLQRRIVALWMISAVARVMQPGCKVDTVLVLHGPQGFFKSTFFRILGGEWFSDSAMDLENKDCYLQMAHAWIYEWGEIGKLTRRRDAEEIKAFITSSSDLYRAPYAKTAEVHPRSMVFVGSTNQQEFLTDPTGNRRFWVLPITQKINLELLREHRDQLWAEALEAYYENTQDGWCLNEFEELDLEATLEQYHDHDSWESILERYLDRRGTKETELTMNEVLSIALELDKKDFSVVVQRRVGDLLRKLGYDSVAIGVRPNRSRVWRKR